MLVKQEQREEAGEYFEELGKRREPRPTTPQSHLSLGGCGHVNMKKNRRKEERTWRRAM
jgi:hypothetical protein